ncbi:MAG TPA: hypothetical protein VLA68_05110 [Nitrososphaera sp.]|nr:hypothetical protein [Nitrososphaera sp.]
MVEDVQILKEGTAYEGKSSDLLADIDNVVDKTLQIYELTSKEGEIIASIGSSVSMLLNTLKVSLSLSPAVFHNDFAGIKSAILNNNAEVIILQSTGNIVTKKFAELNSGQVMRVLEEIIPKLDQSADEKKNEATEKIGMLKKVAKQMQRAKVQLKAKTEPGSEEEID